MTNIFFDMMLASSDTIITMSKQPLTILSRRLPLWKFFAIALALVGTAHSATTVTLQPDGTTANDGDTFVVTGPTNALVGNNYGGAGALGVSAAGTSKGAFDSVLRFDTSSAASTFSTAYGANNWAISSIALQLTVANPSGNALFNSPNAAGQFLTQWLQSDVWTEGSGTPAGPTTTGLTWNSLASLVALGVESEGSSTYNGDAVGTTLTFTLTPSAGLTNDVLSGSQTSLMLSAASTGMTALFNSRNNGVAASRPALIITASALAVPEPGRFLLLLMGLTGIIIRRRR